MTVQFPPIRPSERELVPAVLPQKRVRTESRRTSRRALANGAGGPTVRLTFTNITDAWAESLRQSHNLSKGTYDGLLLPPEVWAGDPELEAFLAGDGVWRFNKPPQFKWAKRGRCTATVELIQKRRDALPGFNPDAPPLLPWIPPTVPDPGPVDPLPDEPDIPDTWPGYYLIHGPSVAGDPRPGSNGEASYPWHVYPVADGFICAYSWELETPDGTQLIPYVSVIKYSPEGAILWEQSVAGPAANWHDANDPPLPGPAIYTLSDGRLLMMCGGYLLTILPTGAELQILGYSGYDLLLPSALSGYVFLRGSVSGYAVVAKKTEALVDVWSYRYTKATLPDQVGIYEAVIDGLGFTYACGITYVTSTSVTNWRVTAIKLDPDGEPVWAKQYDLSGTPPRQEACGCVLLNNGNLFIAGSYIGGNYYKSFVFVVDSDDGAVVSSALLDRPTSWPDGGVTAYGVSIDKGPNGDVYLKLEEYGGLMESTNVTAVAVFAPDGLSIKWSLACSLTDILDNGYTNYFYPYGGRTAITDSTLYLQGFGYATAYIEFYSYCSATIVLPLEGLPAAAVGLYDETRGQYKVIEEAGYFLTPATLTEAAVSILKSPASVTPDAASLTPAVASSPYDLCPQIPPGSRPWTMAWVSIVTEENVDSFYETTYTISSRDGDSYESTYALTVGPGSVNSGNLYQQIYAIPVDEASMLIVPAPKVVYRNDQTPDLSSFYTVYSEVGANFTNLWTMTKYAYFSTVWNCVEVPITQALADGLWAWGDRRWLGLTAGNPNPLDPFMDYGDPSIYSLVPTVNWRPVTTPGSAFNDVQLASATDPEAWYNFVNAGPPRNSLIGEGLAPTATEWVRSPINVGYGYIANQYVPDELGRNVFRPVVVTTLSRDWRPQLLAQFGVALP